MECSFLMTKEPFGALVFFFSSASLEAQVSRSALRRYLFISMVMFGCLSSFPVFAMF